MNIDIQRLQLKDLLDEIKKDESVDGLRNQVAQLTSIIVDLASEMHEMWWKIDSLRRH